MNARDRLIDLEMQFINTHHGREPTHLHVSREDESALSAMSRDEWGGDVAERVRRHGIRAAVTQLLGKTVVWDADETHFA